MEKTHILILGLLIPIMLVLGISGFTISLMPPDMPYCGSGTVEVIIDGKPFCREELKHQILFPNNTILTPNEIAMLKNINNHTTQQILSLQKWENQSNARVFEKLEQTNDILNDKIDALNDLLETSEKNTQMWQYGSVVIAFSVGITFFILGRKI